MDPHPPWQFLEIPTLTAHICQTRSFADQVFYAKDLLPARVTFSFINFAIAALKYVSNPTNNGRQRSNQIRINKQKIKQTNK